MIKTLLALAALTLAMPAVAQQQRFCAPRAAVIERLKANYGESRHAYGIATGGALMEFWVNVETGTWTLTMASPEGVMCLIATGESYRTVEISPGKGDPT